MDTSKKFLMWVDIITLFFIVIGALNWGLVGAFNFDLVKWLAKALRAPSFATIVYIVVGLSALLHIISRDYYLTFLGKTVFPCGSMLERVPEGADIEAQVVVEPNVNVVFWAAESGDKGLDNPWIAYQEYANAGVTKSDAAGVAILRVRSPSTYKVGMLRRQLPAHIHYRVCKHPGMLGRVETLKVDTSK